MVVSLCLAYLAVFWELVSLRLSKCSYKTEANLVYPIYLSDGQPPTPWSYGQSCRQPLNVQPVEKGRLALNFYGLEICLRNTAVPVWQGAEALKVIWWCMLNLHRQSCWTWFDLTRLSYPCAWSTLTYSEKKPTKWYSCGKNSTSLLFIRKEATWSMEDHVKSLVRQKRMNAERVWKK